MKKYLVLLLTVILACSFVACSNNEVAGGNDVDSAAVDTEVTAEKVLRVAVDHDVATIDHHIATDGLFFEVIGSFIEGLLKYDENGALLPAIAESYTVSDDGIVYTFTLRDTTWQDGTPVTANDFVFAWKRLVSQETASEYSYIMSVADVKNAQDIIDGNLSPDELGVKALDDKTFEVTLNSGAPFFLQLMAFPSFFPVNEAFYLAQDGNYGASAENILANGAFKVKSWNKGYGIEVEKNDKYYDADAVKIDGIEWRVFKDSQTGTLEFEAGNIDVAKLTAELVDNYKDDAAFQNEAKGYVWYLAPNYADGGAPEMQNENFRKALGMAFDKDFITDSILNNGSVPADFIIPNRLAASADGTDFRAAQNQDFLSYDVAAAQEYWEKAKAELGTDTVEIELLFDDAESVKQIAEFMQAEWQTNLEGLKVTLKTQPKKQRLQLMRDGDYQIALTRWGPDYADPQTYLELYVPTGGSNMSYDDPEYTALVESIQAGGSLATSDKEAERWAAMLKAEEVLLSKAGLMPVYQSGDAILVNPSVTGIQVNVVGVPHVYTDVEIAD